MKFEVFKQLVRDNCPPLENGHVPVESVKALAEKLGIPVDLSTDGNGWTYAGSGPACRGLKFEDKFLRFDTQGSWNWSFK